MRLPACLAAVAMLWPVSSFAGPASDAVRFFYAPPGFEADPVERERFMDPARAIFDANDRLSGGDEVGCIDFGLAIDGQDYDEGEIARTLVLREEVDEDTAEVTATFRQFPGEEQSRREILWYLAMLDGEWKVYDIASLTGDWQLSAFDCQ